MNSHLERFRSANEKLSEFNRAWHESARITEWLDFKEGYKEERSASKGKISLVDEKIELMVRGDRPVSAYGYEKGKLVGKARSLIDQGFKFGRLSWALTGALLYEKLGYGNRCSVKNKIITAYEKNIQGKPYLRLDNKDVDSLKAFLERNRN